MKAQIIRIGVHTPYESRMRRPHEPPPRPLPKGGSATIIILPIIRIERFPSSPGGGRKRRRHRT